MLVHRGAPLASQKETRSAVLLGAREKDREDEFLDNGS